MRQLGIQIVLIVGILAIAWQLLISYGQKAQALRAAGLGRITVSLDSLDDEVFRAMNDVDFPVQTVLEGIDSAAAAGLPVKVNVVVKRGVNDAGIVDMARHFRGSGHALRFIEYMDVGTTNGWRLDDVVPVPEVEGLLFANEWLDAVPLDVLFDGRLVEVAADGTERLGEPAPAELLEWAARWWPQGRRVEVGLTRDRAWAGAVAKVTRPVS